MKDMYAFVQPYFKWLWDWSIAHYPESLILVIPLLYMVYRVLLYLRLYITALGPYRGMSTKIYKVVDGDTILVNNPLRRKRRYKVRLIGVDAPESLRSLYQNVAPFGAEASQYVKKRLYKGRRVFLYYDKEPRDKFGRVLAYVYLSNGEFLNATLVKKGYAFAKRYPPNVKNAPYFEKLERKAISRKRGLWQIYTPDGNLKASYKRSQDYKNFKRAHNLG